MGQDAVLCVWESHMSIYAYANPYAYGPNTHSYWAEQCHRIGVNTVLWPPTFQCQQHRLCLLVTASYHVATIVVKNILVAIS